MRTTPRLLQNFDRPAGAIKLDYEDFVVEEAPLYPFSGDGTHIYFQLEKRGLNTQQAIHDLAAALDVPRREFGYAGLKDARAVTRQWLSIEHMEPDRLRAIQLPRMRVLEVTRHTNKLKLGHLRGNRFAIRVRNTPADRLADVKHALDELVRRGVPNFFGPQRFGQRGDNADIGRALLAGDLKEVLDLVLGRPGPHDFGEIERARALYDEGKFDAARNRWPGMYRDQRRALKTLLLTGKPRRALASIDRSSIRFYVSALQSEMFNEVLAQRLPLGLHRLQVGDLAWRHANGAVFLVEDAGREQPRSDAFEISPSGPLFGRRMTAAQGRPGELEQRVAEGLPIAALHRGPYAAPGGRRPFRFPISEGRASLGADMRGPYLELAFMLPRGCYATAVLRELFDIRASGPDGEETAE